MAATEEKKTDQAPPAPDTATAQAGDTKPINLDNVVYKETILDSEQCDSNSEIDRRLNRKFDLHILPWLFGIWQVILLFFGSRLLTQFFYIYPTTLIQPLSTILNPSIPANLKIRASKRLFSFVDRSNIGNAKIAGLPESLSLPPQSTQFNLALLVFYIPYILVDIPANLLLKRLRAGIFLPSLITCWGLVCTSMGFIKSLGGLILCRLLLGLFEGGILGGVIIYLAMFYRRHQMLQRSGLFYCAAPLSGAFGGLLAGALGEVKVNGYERWPWIFFSRLSSDFYTLPQRQRGITKKIQANITNLNSRRSNNGRLRNNLLLLHARYARHGQVPD